MNQSASTGDDSHDDEQEEASSPPDQSQSESSWRRLLFPFSSPAPTTTEARNDDTTTTSLLPSDSLPVTPLRDNSQSQPKQSRQPTAADDSIVFWDSAPATDGSASFAAMDALQTPLLQYTTSHYDFEDDHDDHAFLSTPPPTLRRQRSSRAQRRPGLNGLNWLNVVAYSLYSAAFVWTTFAYWRRTPLPNQHTMTLLPLVSSAHWFVWYATRFPLIVLQAAYCLAQLLPVYRNRSMIQSGRDGGIGFAFAHVCVLQLIATVCWSVTTTNMQWHDNSVYDIGYAFAVDELLIQDDDEQQEPVQSQHDWGWRSIMLVQTLATAMQLLVLASLWLRRTSLSITSAGSSFCSIVRRIVDYIVLELPFSWLLGATCVELVHFLAVLVLQWTSPWDPKEYGAWPRAMDYMGLAWLLPVALFALLGWRPGAGSHGERQDDHVMNAMLLQQSATAATPMPAWRPDFCLPAVILVAYVSIAMRLQEVQRLAFEGDEEAQHAIHFYGGVEVAESFVIACFVLTGTVGVVWILALVVWLSRQFCTIRVVQVVLEDDF